MKLIKQRIINSNLPENELIDDIYLVSFPKSGNTWFRFLVANLVKEYLGIDREINFFTIHGVIPDIHISKKISNTGIFGRHYLPRFIKSHAPYNPNYHRVVLLVRNPKDVMVSYYHYLINYGVISENMRISEFVKHRKYGINAWVRHTKSWLFVKNTRQNIQIVKYEDLRVNPQNQIRVLADLLGIHIDEAQIEKVINLSSKETMALSESKHRSFYTLKSQKSAFVRKEDADRGESLSSSDKHYIEHKSHELLQVLDY